MTAMGKKLKTAKLASCTAIGALGSAASAATWAGITPDMVGDGAVSAIRNAAPVLEVLFGFLMGWGARGLLEMKRAYALVETTTTNETREPSNADVFRREQNLEKKALAVAAYKNGGNLNVKPATIKDGSGELLLLGYPPFFHAEITSRTCMRLVLSPWLVDVFNSDQETLSAVSESAIAETVRLYCAETEQGESQEGKGTS